MVCWSRYRLLNQLKQTEKIGNNGASPSDPVLSQPEVQPKIGDEDLPSLKADGQDADFSAQDLGKDEKALELTNGGSHDQDIPGDCQQMQVDRQEMPTEHQGKTDCEHGMPADHEEMPASQQEKVADHHEILAQEQEKATDLQEMPSEHAIETEGSQDNPPICIEMDRSMQNRVDTNDAKDVSIKNPDELDGNQNQMIANDNTLLWKNAIMITKQLNMKLYLLYFIILMLTIMHYYILDQSNNRWFKPTKWMNSTVRSWIEFWSGSGNHNG